MLALLALGSSAVWGTSDFFAGLKSRTVAAPAVVAISQAAALVLLTVLVLARPGTFSLDGWPPWSVAAGLSGSLGLVSFYAALASGTMGVVSPIAALGAVVPVVLGFVEGERPGPLAVLGMAVALTGAALASGPELSGAVSRRPLVLACMAAAGFGTALYCIARGSETSVLHTLWGMRLTSVTLFAAAGLSLRSLGGARRSDLWLLTLIGWGDLLANAMYAVASSQGLVSVAGVLGSLYPVATLLWARFLIGERLRGIQLVGVGFALGGVVLINV